MSIHTRNIIVKAPITSEFIPHNTWYFQKFLEYATNTESALSTLINENKVLLTLIYVLSLAIHLMKIALHTYIVLYWYKQLDAEELSFVISETFFSLLYLLFIVIRYTQRIKGNAEEYMNICSFINFLSFIKYFTWTLWALTYCIKHSSTNFAILFITLYIVHGFLMEKPPNLSFLVLTLCLLIFLFELFIRFVFCKFNTFYGFTSTIKYATRNISIRAYKKTQYKQTTCAICIKRFEEKENVVRLPCHSKHVFHSECIIGWLRASHRCPCCRRSIVLPS